MDNLIWNLTPTEQWLFRTHWKILEDFRGFTDCPIQTDFSRVWFLLGFLTYPEGKMEIHLNNVQISNLSEVNSNLKALLRLCPPWSQLRWKNLRLKESWLFQPHYAALTYMDRGWIVISLTPKNQIKFIEFISLNKKNLESEIDWQSFLKALWNRHFIYQQKKSTIISWHIFHLNFLVSRSVQVP